MEELKKNAYDLLIKNRKTVGNIQYTVPSPQNYPYQWLWDSCFHAIVLSYLSPKDAKKELLSLVAKQFNNGMIPHMIYWEKKKPFGNDNLTINWGKEDTSSITQPPMLAYAALSIYKKDNDKNFLSQIYPNIKRFYNYLLKDRDPRGNHLIGIINPDESGEDNSPRFDIPLGNLSPQHTLSENTKRRLDLVAQNLACDFDAPFCMRNFFWVKDVPFNALFVANLDALSEIAKIFEEENDARYYEHQKHTVARAMRDFMLEDGIYWSTYGTDYNKIKVRTWAMFAPLFARLYTDEEAENVIFNHLLNEDEFWAQFPVPTVAMDESSFDPAGFWRGPTWIATNWFIYKGLLNYSQTDIANGIKDSSVKLIEKSGFREFFDPKTGEGYGATNFTWGALVLDMN